MVKNFKQYKENYLTLARLGLPILVAQLGMIVVGFADNIMLGRYSTEALASASFVVNVYNMALLCLMGFTYGLTPLVGALFGAKNHEAIGATTRVALRVNLIFTAIMTLLMTVLYFNLDRLGQPADLMPLIKPYYLIYLVSMVFVSVYNVMAQWSYGVNDSKTPMWIVLAANLLNVFLNWILIYGHMGAPEMGLIGAGIATLAARIMCAVSILIFFAVSRSAAPYRASFMHPGRLAPSQRKIWQASMPVSFQMAFESGAFTIAAVMCGWLGTIELAAYQILVIIGTLGFCLYYAIGTAVSVGVAHASGDTRAMRRVAFAGYHILLALMTFSSLIFIFFGEALMSVFTDDKEVLAMAASVIIPLVVYQIGDATQVNFANALRGTSRVMPMLWIAFFSYMVVGVPATYLLAFTAGLGLYGVILSFSVSLFTAGALFLTYFLKATKK